MRIITEPFENRIHQIANMETSPFEIERAIANLCFDVARHVMDETYKKNIEAMSFENIAKKINEQSPDTRSEVL